MISSYLGRIEAGEVATEHRELLDAATARGEAVFLALRHVDGLSGSAFAEEFGGPPRAFFAQELDALVEAGLILESEPGDLWLSERGRLLADSVAAQFL